MISIRHLVELICVRMKVSFEDHVEVVEERQGKESIGDFCTRKGNDALLEYVEA